VSLPKVSEDPSLFLYLLVDEICEKKINFSAYNKGIKNFYDIKEATKQFIQRAIREGLKKEQIVEQLKAGSIPETLHEHFIDVISSRTEDIQKSVIHSASHIAQAYLKDFDWKLELVISSEKLSQLREPVLLLHLSVHDNNGKGEKEDIILELPKGDLNSLIKTLESVNQSVQELKV